MINRNRLLLVTGVLFIAAILFCGLHDDIEVPALQLADALSLQRQSSEASDDRTAWANVNSTLPFWSEYGLLPEDALAISYKKGYSSTGIAGCLQQNPTVKIGCDLITQVNNLLVMHILDELLFIFGRLLDHYRMRWWLDSGNLVGAFRFGAYLPWEDDSDIAVMEEDLFNGTNFESLKQDMFREGLIMSGEQCLSTRKDVQICQVAIDPNTPNGKRLFTRILLQVLRNVTTAEQQERFWMFYGVFFQKQKSLFLPRIDVFTYAYYGNSAALRPRSGYWSRVVQRGWKTTDFLPLVPVSFLDHTYKIPRRVDQVVLGWYAVRPEAVRYDIKIYRHNGGVVSPVHLDTRHQPEVVPYLEQYMKDVFGPRFEGFRSLQWKRIQK